MSMDIEERLADAMRQEVAGVDLTRDIVGAAQRRHHRRSVVQRGLFVVGVVGLTGALAAVVTMGSAGPLGPGPDTVRATGAGGESPRLQLAGAVAASQNVSYRLRITSSFEAVGDPESSSIGSSLEGAFDPATATGYLRTLPTAPPGTAYEQRLIDGVLFVGSPGRPFNQFKDKYTALVYDNSLNGAVGASADPSQLFRALQAAHGSVTQTSADTYHVEVDITDGLYGADARQRLVADVTLNADKRIAKVASTRTVEGDKDGRVVTNHYRVTIELSDYGTPVMVEWPNDVVVKG